MKAIHSAMQSLNKAIDSFLNSYAINTVVDVCENVTSGQKTLCEFLSQIEHRTAHLQDDKNAHRFDVLSRCLQDVLQLAVTDWHTFSQSYSCKIGFRDSIANSNVFSLKIKEKNGCPRDWEFRFNSLKRPV